jgi:hypothetical protein
LGGEGGVSHLKDRPEIPASEFIALCAFRYAFGRMSYAVGVVAEWLLKHADKLDSNARASIVRDIREAQRADDEDEAGAAAKGDAPPRWRRMGMECDRKTWLALAEHFERLNEKARA